MTQLTTTGKLEIKEGRKLIARIYNRPVFFEGKGINFPSRYPFNLELVKQGVARECETLQEVDQYLHTYTGQNIPRDEMPPEPVNFTRVNNDQNGNPRYVCHYLNLLVESDYAKGIHTYETALHRAHKLGGRKFHNKQYGGGIVFQSYNIRETETAIQNLIKELEK